MAPLMDRRSLIHRPTLEPIPEQPLVNPSVFSAYFLVFVCCCAAACLALNAGAGQVGPHSHTPQVATTAEGGALSWMSIPTPSTPPSSAHVASPANQQGADTSSVPVSQQGLTVKPIWQFSTGAEALEEQLEQLSIDAAARRAENSVDSEEPAAQQSSRDALLASAQPRTVKPAWQFATGSEALDEQWDELALIEEETGRSSAGSAEPAAAASDSSKGAASSHNQLMKSVEQPWDMKDSPAQNESNPGAGAGDGGVEEQMGRRIPVRAANADTLKRINVALDSAFDEYDKEAAVEVDQFAVKQKARNSDFDEEVAVEVDQFAVKQKTWNSEYEEEMAVEVDQFAVKQKTRNSDDDEEVAVEVDQFAVKQKPVNSEYDEEVAVEVDQFAVKQKPESSEYELEEAVEAEGATPVKAQGVGRRPVKAQLPFNSRKLGVADASQKGDRNERDGAWSEMFRKESAGNVGLSAPQTAAVMVRRGALRLLEQLVLALWPRRGGLGENLRKEEGTGPASTILAADAESLEGEVGWQDIAPRETGKRVNWVLGSLADSVGDMLDEAAQASASDAGTFEAAAESALQGRNVVHLDQEVAQGFV